MVVLNGPLKYALDLSSALRLQDHTETLTSTVVRTTSKPDGGCNVETVFCPQALCKLWHSLLGLLIRHDVFVGFGSHVDAQKVRKVRVRQLRSRSRVTSELAISDSTSR